MDIAKKCEKDNTMIHCFEFKEEIVFRFIKAVEGKKIAGSNVVERLIIDWLEREGL
ncbi:hypothetical protein [Endozoicomonas sp.]|uniref:hypothetical protein n=1 Tax=Endozoicomonas sp. TaxID=1892382 RepID=UPI00383A621B